MAPRPALFRRLPSVRWRPRDNEEILPRDAQRNYTAFAEDFELLEEHLMPSFRTFDNEALRAQNQFYLEQLVLIFGAAAAAVLGAVQTSLTDAAWPGIIEAVLGATLAAVALRARQLGAQRKYLRNRLKAERLRGEYFMFVGRVGDYADEQTRVRRLRETVALVRTAEEPS
jgi:hypothetical protein